MKSFLFAFSFLVLSLNSAVAEKPYNQDPVSVEMQTYPLREILLLIVKNNSRTTQTIMLNAGPMMTIPDSQSMRFSIAPGEEKTQTIKFGSVEGLPLPLIVDYRVSYVREETKSRVEIYNPVQFFVKNRDGEYALTDGRSMMAFQKPTLERDQRAEPARIDLGAGVTVETTLENLAFPSYEGTQEEQDAPVEVIRAEVPKILAEKLAINSLPTNIKIPARPIPPAPRVNPINVLEKTFIEKGATCDPLGLFTCFMGQLKAVNLKKGGTPASWGWRVELWSTKVIFGTTMHFMVGSTETDGSGEWVIKLPVKDAPISAKVIFKPTNRFVSVVNPSTLKPYQYQDVVFKETYRKSLYKGISPGAIASIFHYSNSLWVRLVNGGINPLYAFGTFNIAYPNALTINGQQSPCTTKNEFDSIIPWSCALSSPTGGIYLIPGHEDSETVVHELGHKIHALFWGKFPPGSGGSHSMWKCYTKGLAITEGFANFLAAWMNSKSRDDSAGWFHGVNVETFRNGACFTAQNELAVVGMLWDLYDTQHETVLGDSMSDQASFYSDANVIADFLGNGIQVSAPAYLESLKARNPQADPQLLWGLFNLNNVAF